MIDIFSAGIIIAITVFIGLGVYFFNIKKNNSNSSPDLKQNTEIAELKEKLKLLEKEKVDLGFTTGSTQKLTNTSIVNVLDEVNESTNGNIEKRNRPEGNDSGPILESQELLDLKKKLSILEEENEELNDDYTNLRKKSIRKNEEVEELETKLKESAENNVKLESDKIELESVNAEITAQLKDKQNSLGFVNGILNASSSNSRDFEEISNKTWEIYSFIYNNSEIIEFNDDDIDEAWQWMNNEKKTWLKNKTTVAIVGEFSAGKTTIVNTILKANDPQAVMLPTDSKETTAIPTYISNGKEFNCEFYAPNGELKIISKEIFKNVTKTALENVNVSSLIKYFVLKYPNKSLENISILDTPGFGSNDQKIINRTIEVIKETDALFWVMDINQGDLNESSLKVIKEYLGNIPLFVILNKADTKSKTDQEIAKVKIVKTLNDQEIKYQNIIAFSNKENPNVIIDLINGLRKAPAINILGKINYYLKKSIEDLKKESLDLHMNEKELSDNCEIVGNNFKVISSNVKFNITEATELFEYSNPFIGKNSYKIMETDKKQFDDYIYSTLEDLDEYPKQIDSYLEYNNKLKSVINKKNSVKSDIKYYEELLKTFTILVNQYDPKLLKAQ